LKGVPTGITGLFAEAGPVTDDGSRLASSVRELILDIAEQASGQLLGFDTPGRAQPPGAPAPRPPLPPPSPAPRPSAPAPGPGATPGEPPGPRLDMGRFLSDAIGPTVDVKLTSGAAKGSDGVDLSMGVRA